MQKAIGQEDLKKMIKESVREVLREERLSLCEILIPRVSKKEMQEIQAAYGSPSEYHEDDFVDVTDWIKE